MPFPPDGKAIMKFQDSKGHWMIEKIPLHGVAVGMYVHDINCEGVDPAYLPRQFLISDRATLAKVRALGTPDIFIDTSKALYLPGGLAEEAEAGGRQSTGAPQEDSRHAPAIHIPPSSPVDDAKRLFSDATRMMRDMMNDIRIGKKIDMRQCERIVNDIMASVNRAPSVMLPLVQLKSYDQYTYQHCIAVSALAVAFGQVEDMPGQEIYEFAMGGLLHDVGKAFIPGRILNKPARLDNSEFGIMKSHVEHTTDILKKTQGVSEIAFNAAAHHHERYDGNGYPEGLQGDEISVHGQMMAIVDVYDAITSSRVYHKGVPPSEAVGRLFNLSTTHFNRRLVQAFIKGIGIYPAGSLVKLASERLAVVRDVNSEQLLKPSVLVIYDCNWQRHIIPEPLDLADSTDCIVSHEDYGSWGINQSLWL
jgi:putative nucleotidyltransferase with HDIG domain